MASSNDASYRTAVVKERPVSGEIKPAKKASSKAEPPVWKKAVIGGAIAVVFIAAALRLRKANDDGELDDAKDALKKKEKQVGGESRKISRDMEIKAKKAGHSVEDKTNDAAGLVLDTSHKVLDSGRHAAEVVGDKIHHVGDKLHHAKDAGSDEARKVKDDAHHAQGQAEAKARQLEGSKEARRMADKNVDEDVGFLGWKNWFAK